MSPRPRHSPPPFQVMKAYPPGKPASGGESLPAGPKGAGQWLKRGAQPMMLRLPRGWVMAVAVLLVVAIVVAFVIGYSQGQQRPTDSSGVPGVPVPMLPGDPVPVSMGGGPVGPAGPGVSAHPGVTSPGVGPVAVAGAGRLVSGKDVADRRVSGLNYYVQNYPEEWAVRLMRFLISNGVEAQVIKPHNSRFFQVVPLKGFTKETLDNEGREFKRALDRLGRYWKAQNPGATDLSGMYPVRYDGTKSDLVIQVER